MQYFEHPYEELKDYCLAHDYQLIYMDIDISDVLTEVTYANLKTQTLPFEALGQFDIDEVFIDAVKITQKFAFEPVRAQKPRADFRIAADKNVDKVVAVFYAEQCDLDADDEELAEEIERAIVRKFIKARLLVGIRKLYSKKTIIEAIAKLRAGAQKVNLPLAKGVSAIEGKPARIIEHYKQRAAQKEKSAEQGEAESAAGSRESAAGARENAAGSNAAGSRERGFVYPARVDDLIVEYTFATANRNGRNMHGEELKSELVRANREVPFKVDETLREIRDNFSARFYANMPGYVEYTAYKALYGIRDEMLIKAANFKDTGSIEGGGRDTNITLRINEVDEMVDAVGANVTLDVAKLKIDGSVAQNAVVKAVSAQIGGQTHKLSKVIASQIEIARHRGYAKGDDVKISTLEGGKIEGKHVQVQNALGGEILAEICEVENARANTNYTITSSIKIQKCQGENIRINVTLAQDERFLDKIRRIQQASAEREIPLENLPRQVSQKRSLIEKNRESIAAIQDKIAEYAARKTPVPAAFAIKVKEFRALVDEYNKLRDELADMRAKQEHDDELLAELQEKIFNCKVECLSPWMGACEVRFELLNPHKTISWVSAPGEEANLIYLARGDDGEVYIKKEKY